MNFIKRMAFVVFFHYVCTKIACNINILGHEKNTKHKDKNKLKKNYERRQIVSVDT